MLTAGPLYELSSPPTPESVLCGRYVAVSRTCKEAGNSRNSARSLVRISGQAATYKTQSSETQIAVLAKAATRNGLPGPISLMVLVARECGDKQALLATAEMVARDLHCLCEFTHFSRVCRVGSLCSGPPREDQTEASH